MNELIKITANEQGSQAVSARDLFEYLESKAKFADWCNRMFEYGFEEGRDFITILGKSSGGRPSTDYALTLDTAKEIAMLQRTEKGKQARQYFIECEKQLREVVKPMSTLDFLQVTLNQMKAQEQRLDAVESKMLEIEAKTTTRPEYFTIMGFAILKGVQVGLSLAGQLGKKAMAICRARGYHVDKIHDPRFGQVGCYPKDVLEEVFG